MRQPPPDGNLVVLGSLRGLTVWPGTDNEGPDGASERELPPRTMDSGPLPVGWVKPTDLLRFQGLGGFHPPYEDPDWDRLSEALTS